MDKSAEEFNPDKVLTHTLFLQREYEVSHLPYEQEFTFYNAVKEGDLKLIKKIMLPLRNDQLGRLSDDGLRNLKYHLIITIALVTRFCIEGGMPPETAYTLSDVYIQKIDKCKKEEEINELHQQSILDYAQKMKKIQKKKALSQAVLKAMDYIYDHLHEKIILEELSEYVGYNKTYLCDLFKKETGFTIGQYITNRKIEAAQNMLVYPEYTSVAIGNYLAFSSHSHFINTFKKETGSTPKEYRKEHYRSHFTMKNGISDYGSLSQ